MRRLDSAQDRTTVHLSFFLCRTLCLHDICFVSFKHFMLFHIEHVTDIKMEMTIFVSFKFVFLSFDLNKKGILF